jgi:hypothetical protein
MARLPPVTRLPLIVITYPTYNARIKILLTGYSRKLPLADFDKFEGLDSLLKGFQSAQDTTPRC